MKNNAYEHLTHVFDCYYENDSTILILGSFPSVSSRQEGFYYAHKQNRFWKLLPLIFNEEVCLTTINEKKAFLKKHHLALWDVVEQCDIINSQDATIKNVTPTDLFSLIQKVPIKKIYCNGQTAYRLYQHYQQKSINLPVVVLPSTSGANASYSLLKLLDFWQIINS